MTGSGARGGSITRGKTGGSEIVTVTPLIFFNLISDVTHTYITH